MKQILALLCLFPFGVTPASAFNSDEVLPWFEMSVACEALVAVQSKKLWSQYPETAPVNPSADLQQMAIRHPTENLVATATEVDGRWVLCHVAAVPALPVSDAEALIYAWGNAQRLVIQGPSHVSAMLPSVYQPWSERQSTPARVRCHAGSLIAATFSYGSTAGDFQVGSASEMPPGGENPCSSKPNRREGRRGDASQ
ncbi:hypothetical protein KMP13_09710 [Epibacterium ulvae]|uniref:hypothetical protein n=1 Tax=Epibacterium ulvae TaxID=1156985 RepID=UPI001BFC5AA1|nr:hypothetical protein [Epibacterium ulvae]MBT8154166.1 hypothetical protein [Epibacterium ulvae]